MRPSAWGSARLGPEAPRTPPERQQLTHLTWRHSGGPSTPTPTRRDSPIDVQHLRRAPGALQLSEAPTASTTGPLPQHHTATATMHPSFQLPNELVISSVSESYPCRGPQIRSLSTLLCVRQTQSGHGYTNCLLTLKIAKRGSLSQYCSLWHRSHWQVEHSRRSAAASVETPRCHISSPGSGPDIAICHSQLRPMHHGPTPLRADTGSRSGCLALGCAPETMRVGCPAYR